MAEQDKKRLTVMISSTIVDLPEHRKEAMDACLRQGMFPLMMEHQPASYANPVDFSIGLVNQADIYVGVYAERYGFVPPGHDISLTEIEYNRAVERGIPRLLFVMDKNHPFRIEDVEVGERAGKLRMFKERIGLQNFENFFKSPVDLRAHIINSLSRYRESDSTAFHYISEIPAPPVAYIAHPYVLLQTHDLIGRRNELSLLADWISNPSAEVHQARVLCMVSIGGMGKSALTWKWFNDVAPRELETVSGKEWGRMWWSFYESDATFENFVTRALAYVSQLPCEQVEKIPTPDRETQLLTVLDRERFLIVLDGLERILIAYARMDAARLGDDNLDEETANRVAGALGLPDGSAQSFIGQHWSRRTADPRAGNFLRKLARVRCSRILVSTRLCPADLQLPAGGFLLGCSVLFLQGLVEDDALELWREFNATGSRDDLLALFRSFEYHPLLIQTLASAVAADRRADGDFAEWQKGHPNFNPFRLPLVQLKSHVLEFSLRGLDQASRKVLETLAAFRMPVSYDTLVALFVQRGFLAGLRTRMERQRWMTLSEEAGLDKLLVKLEDRGLVAWDRLSNRYDLHPIVRGVVWSGLDETNQKRIYRKIERHLKSLPKVDERKVKSLDDLTGTIELYNVLIERRRYRAARRLFYRRLHSVLTYRLGVGHKRAELLEMLFPNGISRVPRLGTGLGWYARSVNALGMAYESSGRPSRAIPLYQKHNSIMARLLKSGFATDGTKAVAFRNLDIGLGNLSSALRVTGALCMSEKTARWAISHSDKGTLEKSLALSCLKLTLATRLTIDEGSIILPEALSADGTEGTTLSGGSDTATLAQWALWSGNVKLALKFADRAVELCDSDASYACAKRLLGAAALALGRLSAAEECLHEALVRCRLSDSAEEELQALVTLAELRYRQNNLKGARELLEDVWEPVERGPYPLFQADAFNLLAQIERDAGNRDVAVEAATKAYRLAWCDGPPYAYHWGLDVARNHFAELGASEPLDLPPFDEPEFDPMHEVEIESPDKSQQ